MRTAAQHQVVVNFAGEINVRAAGLRAFQFQAGIFAQGQVLIVSERKARAFELQRLARQHDVAGAGVRTDFQFALVHADGAIARQLEGVVVARGKHRRTVPRVDGDFGRDSAIGRRRHLQVEIVQIVEHGADTRAGFQHARAAAVGVVAQHVAQHVAIVLGPRDLNVVFQRILGARLAANDRARGALAGLAELDFAQQDGVGIFIQLGELALVFDAFALGFQAFDFLFLEFPACSVAISVNFAPVAQLGQRLDGNAEHRGGFFQGEELAGHGPLRGSL